MNAVTFSTAGEFSAEMIIFEVGSEPLTSYQTPQWIGFVYNLSKTLAGNLLNRNVRNRNRSASENQV